MIGGVSICHGYMCILLYTQPIWCYSIPNIYAQLKGVSICHGYICMLLYMKPIWCNGIPENLCSIEGESICHGYICILLYMQTYLLLQYSRYLCSIGGGVNLPCIYVHAALYESLCGVMVFQRSMINWMGVSICHGYMCMLLYMKPIWCNGIPEIYA